MIDIPGYENNPELFLDWMRLNLETCARARCSDTDRCHMDGVEVSVDPEDVDAEGITLTALVKCAGNCPIKKLTPEQTNGMVDEAIRRTVTALGLEGIVTPARDRIA